MKLLFGVIVAVLAAVAIAQQRDTFSPEPLGWAAISGLGMFSMPIATKKDLLVHPEVNNLAAKRGSSANEVMVIRRRNAEGAYNRVAAFTEDSSVAANTNGKWIALLSNSYVTLFSIDQNNTLSEASYVESYGGYLLSDDTFVGCDGGDEQQYVIRTYQYEASNNTWSMVPGTELNVSSSSELYAQGDIASYRVSDTHLVLIEESINTTTVHIYARQADLSWNFIESVAVNSSLGTKSINFNGVDTLVLTHISPDLSILTENLGTVFTYTKINDKWVEQTITPDSLGYRPLSLFGASVLFVDTTSVLLSAGLEGIDFYSQEQIGGKVLLLNRNAQGTWVPSLDLVAKNKIFGLGVGMNDYDIIFGAAEQAFSATAIISFYAAPRCFAQPINVTCNDQQANDCSQAIDTQSLYTINNPQCGAIETTLSINLVNNAVQTQFSFNKGFGPVVQCNAKVTCPTTPSATNNISSAGIVQLGLASFVTAVLMLV